MSRARCPAGTCSSSVAAGSSACAGNSSSSAALLSASSSHRPRHWAGISRSAASGQPQYCLYAGATPMRGGAAAPHLVAAELAGGAGAPPGSRRSTRMRLPSSWRKSACSSTTRPAVTSAAIERCTCSVSAHKTSSGSAGGGGDNDDDEPPPPPPPSPPRSAPPAPSATSAANDASTAISRTCGCSGEPTHLATSSAPSVCASAASMGTPAAPAAAAVAATARSGSSARRSNAPSSERGAAPCPGTSSKRAFPGQPRRAAACRRSTTSRQRTRRCRAPSRVRASSASLRQPKPAPTPSSSSRRPRAKRCSAKSSSAPSAQVASASASPNALVPRRRSSCGSAGMCGQRPCSRAARESKLASRSVRSNRRGSGKPAPACGLKWLSSGYRQRGVGVAGAAAALPSPSSAGQAAARPSHSRACATLNPQETTSSQSSRQLRTASSARSATQPGNVS